MKAKTTSKSPKARTERAKPRSVKRVVRPSEAYDHLSRQMAEIERDFINGASVIRLTHKYSLPLKCVETVLRMKLMARRPNVDLSDRGGNK